VTDNGLGYATAPNMNGDRPLPRSNRPKGLLPSTWLEREIRVEHLVGGAVRETSGTLAELLDQHLAASAPKRRGRPRKDAA
jgi:hypothetical protein